MLNYILEMMICQALFLGLYQLLKSEPLFKVNRVYLLFSLTFSLVLPLFSFSDVLPYQVSQTYVEWLQPLQIGGEITESAMSFSQKQIEASKGFQWNMYAVVYGIGLVLYLFWFIFRNRQLFKYLNLNSFEDYKFKSVVRLPHTSIAFSFLDRIYLGENIPESQRQVILEHEYQHLQKKHSWDLLFVEGLQFIMWFNPLIYLYKLQIRQLHEFEVDHSVTTQYSSTKYINTLLNLSFGSQNVSFINTFSHRSNLKKRINMLQHTHNSNLKKLKYLLILPVMFLAVLFSCSQDELVEQELTEEEHKEEITKFIKTFVDQEPNIFKRIKEKPTLDEILSIYGLEIKDNYSKIEKDKVGIVLTMITVMTENDKLYQKEILQEINNSKGLSSAYEKSKKELKDHRRNGHESKDLKSDYDVPFALIDSPPHPESCSGLTGDELKKCMSDFIGKHISDTFKLSDLDLDLKPGRKRISVQFKIDKNGKITNVRARGPSPALETEAIKTIQSLPQFIPGEQDGEKVGVLYGLPINFIIDK